MNLRKMSSEKHMERNERVKSQTADEWIEEYSSGIVVPDLRKPLSESPSILTLKYDHHRTAKAKSNSVILSFTDANGDCYDAFFNVDLNSQRGVKKGKQRKVGEGGQFLPAKRGKFRKWYISIVGKAPDRWSVVHKQLRSRLKELTFTGDVDTSYTSDGRPFKRLKNVRVIHIHNWDKIGTNDEQYWDIPF